MVKTRIAYFSMKGKACEERGYHRNRRWSERLADAAAAAGAFITGSTFLADGRATASCYYGPLQL